MCNDAMLVLGAAFTHAPKGMLSILPQVWTEEKDSGMKLCTLCMKHALAQLNF